MPTPPPTASDSMGLAQRLREAADAERDLAQEQDFWHEELLREAADRLDVLETPKASTLDADPMRELQTAGQEFDAGEPWTIAVPSCPVSEETASILRMIASGRGSDSGNAACAGVDAIWGYADPEESEQAEQIDRAVGNIVVAIRAAVAGYTLQAVEVKPW